MENIQYNTNTTHKYKGIRNLYYITMKYTSSCLENSLQIGQQLLRFTKTKIILNYIFTFHNFCINILNINFIFHHIYANTIMPLKYLKKFLSRITIIQLFTVL